MTVIAMAVGHDRTIHAASDTRTMAGGHIFEGSGTGKLALYDFEGTSVLFGSAGLAGVGRLVNSLPRPAPPVKADPGAWAWQFADTLTRAMLERNMMDSDGIADMAGLLGWDGRLWFIDHCDATPVVDGWAAVGSGRDYAAGALHALYDECDPDEAVRRAVDAAGQNDACHLAGFQSFELKPVIV